MLFYTGPAGRHPGPFLKYPGLERPLLSSLLFYTAPAGRHLDPFLKYPGLKRPLLSSMLFYTAPARRHPDPFLKYPGLERPLFSYISFGGGGEEFLIFFVLYSTLLHLPPLRFHCADGCCGIEPRTVATGALAVRRSNH
jgi:hypothetical protein